VTNYVNIGVLNFSKVLVINSSNDYILYRIYRANFILFP